MCSFTALEESVINLLQMKEAVDGMSGVRKFGANSTYTTGDDTATGTSNNAEQDVYTVHDYMCNQHDMGETDELVSAPSPPRCSSTARTPRAPFNRAVPKKQTLLEQQVNNQMEYHKRSISVLEEISSSLKSLVKYKRRQVDIDEKNYKLAKRKFDHELKLDVENKKLKVAKLELKKEMIEIEKNRI